MLRRFTVFTSLMAAAVSVALLAGCNDSQTGAPEQGGPPPSQAQTTETIQDTDHGHKPGAHGGLIVEIGRDNYHAEAVFEKDGVLRLHTLGKDEAKVQEVETQTLTAYAKPEGGTESASFALKPEPQPGDAEGKTSLFVGKLPQELWGQRVDVTIPSIKIAGERFRLGFQSAPESHGDDGMPAKVSDAGERQLYLTAGGMYTNADISANGNVTASQKFKGVKAKHDLRPKAGDKICPITLTKANPKFTWVVAGKTYEFCCPPCVDEFVRTAKENQAEIREPEDYVKK